MNPQGTVTLIVNGKEHYVSVGKANELDAKGIIDIQNKNYTITYDENDEINKLNELNISSIPNPIINNNNNNNNNITSINNRKRNRAAMSQSDSENKEIDDDKSIEIQSKRFKPSSLEVSSFPLDNTIFNESIINNNNTNINNGNTDNITVQDIDEQLSALHNDLRQWMATHSMDQPVDPNDDFDKIRIKMKLLWMKTTSITLDSTLNNINNMNNNLNKLKYSPTTDKLSIEEIIRHYNEIKTLYNNNHDLKKIIFKMNLHCNSEFVPKNKQFKCDINSRKIKDNSQESFEYIKVFLVNAEATSVKLITQEIAGSIKLLNHNNNVIDKILMENKIGASKYYSIIKRDELLDASEKDAMITKHKQEINLMKRLLFSNKTKLNNNLIKYKEDLVNNFQKLLHKLKKKTNDNKNIYKKFNQSCLRRKQNNRARKLNDEYKSIDNNMNDYEKDDDWKNYNPKDRIFKQFDYIKLDNHGDKSKIIKYFGNAHDLYCHQSEIKSFNRKQKIIKERTKNNKIKIKKKKKIKNKIKNNKPPQQPNPFHKKKKHKKHKKHNKNGKKYGKQYKNHRNQQHFQ